MRQTRRSRHERSAAAGSAARPPTGHVDLGLALSIYAKHADGSLIEIGDPASPLTRHSAAGTWPTEQ